MITVLIVDDMKILAECLKLAIQHNSDFKVVGCANNGIEAYEMCAEFHPDVVLMDILMPICDGIEATKRIKKEFQNTKILILTTIREETSINKAIEYGADGYILKDISGDELILSIRSVYTGLNLIHKEEPKVDALSTGINRADETDKINITEMVMQPIRVIEDDGSISGEIRSKVMEIVNKALEIQKNIDVSMYLTQDQVNQVIND